MLSGCNWIDAKAADQAARTRRADDLHQQQMIDNQALAPTRLATKEVAMWTLTGGLVVGMVILLLAGSYYVFALAYHKAQHASIQQIRLDPVTRQYPLLIYKGNRAYTPITGDRVLLDKEWLAGQDRIEAATRVQIAGLLESEPPVKLLWGGE